MRKIPVRRVQWFFVIKNCPLLREKQFVSLSAAKQLCLFLNTTPQDSRKFVKGVLLGVLVVNQETVGSLWDKIIRYHIHNNLLMDPIMIHFTSLHCIKFDFNIIIQSLLLCSRSNFMIYNSYVIYISCLFNLHWFEHMYVNTAITKGNAGLKSVHKFKSGSGSRAGLNIKMEGLTDWQSVLTCLWLKFKTVM